MAFLTTAPLAPEHVLVVPIEETDHRIDLDFANADSLATSESLDDAASRIRFALDAIHQCPDSD